jgi:hypothetical protein
MIKNVYVFMYNTVILVRFQWNLNFLDRLSKNSLLYNFMKICPVGTKLFLVDGQRDMTKLTVTFRNLAKAL